MPNQIPDPDRTEITDKADARAAHQPDRPPTPDEEAAAPEGPAPRSVVEAYADAAERGADVEGEGQIS